MRKLLSALSAILLLAGCTPTNSVTYTGLEAGTIGSSVFTTDNGAKMNVVGNDGKYDVSTSRRVLVNYESRPVTNPDVLDIDVLGLWDAYIVTPASASLVPEDAVDTPVKITDAWFNAGYLNILATVAGKNPDGHVFSAAYTASTEKITLRLYHDGTADASSNSTQSFFISIRMDDPVTSYGHNWQAEGKEPVYPAPILLQWTWYALDESGPVTLYERNGTYTPPSAN